MKEILVAISLLSLKFGEGEFASSVQKENNWLGFEPATEQQILDAEKRLNVELPADYKDFLLITNGFTAPTTIDPSFMKIEDIDYLSNLDPFAIEVWSQYEELRDVAEALKRSILVGGKDEEQYFLLIPPLNKTDKWRYWTFASWKPGEHEHFDLTTYFQYVLEFIKERD